jgi:diguanylate cyclase (GGDEF)-like protein
LYAPLLCKDHLEGCVELVGCDAARHVSAVESELIEVVVALAAVALQNARLCREVEIRAVTDSLTGAFNHRYLQKRLAQELARARRYGEPLSLLMMDVDWFKRYNDARGHRAGDALLSDVAALLEAQTRRQVDLVARYGGDEFAVLLPNTDIVGAATLAERLRTSVAARGAEDPDAAVAVSIGLSSVPAFALTAERLVETADRALYRAKRLGRNRVELFRGPVRDRQTHSA